MIENIYLTDSHLGIQPVMGIFEPQWLLNVSIQPVQLNSVWIYRCQLLHLLPSGGYYFFSQHSQTCNEFSHGATVMQVFNRRNRVTFHRKMGIMEVDFSDLTFVNSAQVNALYDAIESMIRDTDQKWYFLVNYRAMKIEPEAWFQHAIRGKDINVANSLGTVRFDPREATREQILLRANQEGFNPNIVSTREEALLRIDELKQAKATALA